MLWTSKGASQEAFFANSGESSSSDVDVLSLHDSTAEVQIATCCNLEIRVARRRVRFVVFKTVQVLISLAAYFTAVRLFLLHA
jgi:hypothetical protein